MKNHHLFWFSIVAFYFFGCTSDDKLSSYAAEPIGSFAVAVPLDSKPNLKSSKYLASANALYGFNYEHQTIYINHLEEGQPRVEKINIKKEGPDGVGIVHSMSVRSADSIFLTTGAGAGALALVDRSGRPLDKIEYDFGEEQESDFTSLRNRHQKDVVVYRDSLLFFPQRVPFRGARPEKIRHKPIGYYNFSTRSFALVDFEYPPEYWEQNLLDDFTFGGDGEHLYYGLAAQHHIWKIGIESGSKEKILMKSNHFPENFVGEGDFDDVHERTDFLVTQPQYNSLLVDTYRDVLYRIAIIPYEDDKYSKSKSVQLFSYPDNFTVIVSKKSGEYIGEFTFPSRTYFPYWMFVSEEGLNIPKSHPEYLVEYGSEDEVVYDTFDLTF